MMILDLSIICYLKLNIVAICLLSLFNLLKLFDFIYKFIILKNSL